MVLAAMVGFLYGIMLEALSFNRPADQAPACIGSLAEATDNIYVLGRPFLGHLLRFQRFMPSCVCQGLNNSAAA